MTISDSNPNITGAGPNITGKDPSEQTSGVPPRQECRRVLTRGGSDLRSTAASSPEEGVMFAARGGSTAASSPEDVDLRSAAASLPARVIRESPEEAFANHASAAALRHSQSVVDSNLLM